MIDTFLIALGEPAVQLWMQQAFYPVLFLVLVAASLGVPIPEDVPLVAAGVILHTHPGAASWVGTFIVALIGVMVGDVILYRLGQRWGPDVFNHRSVRRLLTPQRFDQMSARFRRYGTWMCFFGRFVMGVRGAMCLSAGVTQFPFWRFVLADLCGALLSIPAFVWLGYCFAGMVPSFEAYLTGIKWVILCLALALAGGFILYGVRAQRRGRRGGPNPESADDPEPTPDAQQMRFRPAPGQKLPAPDQAGSEQPASDTSSGRSETGRGQSLGQPPVPVRSEA
jgi:membrane protein DedA with SNARE-associated domain